MSHHSKDLGFCRYCGKSPCQCERSLKNRLYHRQESPVNGQTAMISSPRRYFLNAPKEQPGTCFVLNDDYMDLWQKYEDLCVKLATAVKCGCHHSVGCRLYLSASSTHPKTE